ncbi:MAG: hypothetical protein HYU51_08335 [Candidatus Rokubacteria bacterium]|nr:hypothetical protein [Candidatus Rokubacteria bacterium]
MACPYLEEVAMLFCRAYPVKKLLPRDRITTASPCLSEGFERCPLFQEILARVAAVGGGAGRAARTVPGRKETLS